MEIVGIVIALILGFAVGFFSGEGSEHYFRYKTKIAELKAEEEKRMEEYVKRQRGGKE